MEEKESSRTELRFVEEPCFVNKPGEREVIKSVEELHPIESHPTINFQAVSDRGGPHWCSVDLEINTKGLKCHNDYCDSTDVRHFTVRDGQVISLCSPCQMGKES